MKKIGFLCFAFSILLVANVFAQESYDTHPNTSAEGWKDLFNNDLSNAIYTKGVWNVDKDGVMTATKDDAIWSNKAYNDFILDLEFKNAPGTNSGVIVHASDIKEWIPHSVEIQIADDYADEWAKSPETWQCAAVFGHQAAAKHVVKKPGEWNHYTITCKGQKIWIVLNGQLVNECDMSKFTSTKTNPDGSEVP